MHPVRLGLGPLSTTAVESRVPVAAAGPISGKVSVDALSADAGRLRIARRTA